MKHIQTLNTRDMAKSLQNGGCGECQTSCQSACKMCIRDRAEGDGRSRLYLRVWAKDLKAEGFCKKCRFRKSETVPMEVLPGVTLDITTWEKLWR